MTSYLLDTNALIFAALRPEKVPDSLRAVLRNESQTLRASVASVYEVGNKHRIGKLELSTAGLFEVTSAFRIILVPIGADIMEQASRLNWQHRDPWDRIIAAQAISLGATLLSSDRAFDAVPGLARLW